MKFYISGLDIFICKLQSVLKLPGKNVVITGSHRQTHLRALQMKQVIHYHIAAAAATCSPKLFNSKFAYMVVPHSTS